MISKKESENKDSFPNVVVGDLRLIKLFINKVFSILNTAKSVEDSPQRHWEMTLIYKRQGFTLIELLVVVLMIGVLAAVALPQYQKAVEKSRAAEALILLKHLHEAGRLYLMNNPGALACESFEDLGVELPADYTLVDEADEGEIYCNKHWCVMTSSALWGAYSVSAPDSPAMFRCDGWEDGDAVNFLYGLQYLGNIPEEESGWQKNTIVCINSDKWCKSLFGTPADSVVNL